MLPAAAAVLLTTAVLLHELLRCSQQLFLISALNMCSAVLQTAAVVLPTAAVVLPKAAVVLSSAADVQQAAK